MSGFDHERIESLLNIVEKCAGHTGKLSHIASAAMAQLAHHNEDAREMLAEHKKQQEAEAAEAGAPPADGETIFTGDNANPNLERRV